METKKNYSLVSLFQQQLSLLQLDECQISEQCVGGRGSLQLAVWIFHQGSQFVAISAALTTRYLGLFSAFGRSDTLCRLVIPLLAVCRAVQTLFTREATSFLSKGDQ